jgi:hypothetical protein
VRGTRASSRAAPAFVNPCSNWGLETTFAFSYARLPATRPRNYTVLSASLSKDVALPKGAQVARIIDHFVFTTGIPLGVDRREFEECR